MKAQGIRDTKQTEKKTPSEDQEPKTVLYL